MSRFNLPSFALALPVTLLSQAAFADLTPTEVWGDWRQYMEGMGYKIVAKEAPDGDNLIVSDIALQMELPEDEGSMSMSLGTLTFTQNSDGSVAIVMPEAMPMTINITPEGDDAKPVELVLNYAQTGHAMTASGSSDKLKYDYNADTISVTLDRVQVGPDTFGEENAKVNVIATGVSSSTDMIIGDLREYTQTGQVDSVQYDIAIKNPEDPVAVAIKGGLSGLNFDGIGKIPMTLVDASDMAAMLAAGFSVDGNVTLGAGNTEMNVSDPENGDFALTSSSSGGNLSVEMGAEGLAYAGGQKDIDVNITATAMPFPIAISMAEGGFNLKMPVSKSDDPQDFALGFTLDQFKMSDMIWGIFDPTGQLPRDPATLVVDLSGKAKLLFDLMDPDSAAKMGEAEPGELQALTVNKLALDAAGAKFDGSGDFTFDNSDKVTFDGMPKPVGAVDLSLVGGNGLLDKLVAMGLLPEEQAMGARMMMGLFAVPGDGEDTLKSKIEFTDEGQILANGQRIK
tara:strand:+ start:78412 stop:79944 length:1533 start_codon:yes stop_codon:yes gene_type:complete